jgi:hypothetical protein
MRLAALVLVLAGLAAGAQAQEATLGCAAGDKQCAIAKIRAHPARKLEFWSQAMARPLHERIGLGGPELVEYLTLDNLGNGYPQRPRVPAPDRAFIAEMHAALVELPAPVKRLLERKLAGIYLIEDFGGTGFTDEVMDASGKPVAGFIVLDPSVLRAHTANSWITWRENTPFKPDAGHTLIARIAAPAADDRKGAIQYILLHELAHVISIGAKVHPSWAISAAEVGPTAAFPYFGLSWRVDKGRYATLFDDTFAERGNVVFYFGPRLEAAQMKAAYEGLERTNFATLYSATHPGDDFAEAFANYVHVVMMKKPFAIEIGEGGRPVKTYRPCWEEPRCAAKRRLIEELLRP